MTKTWLDKLCDPLEHPQYPQIKGHLVQYVGTDIVGKCAEGEIACQNHIVYSRSQLTLPSKDLISIGIPKDLATELPSIYNISGELSISENLEDGFNNIGTYIFTLNDAGYTYKQIVKFLRTTFEDAV